MAGPPLARAGAHAADGRRRVRRRGRAAHAAARSGLRIRPDATGPATAQGQALAADELLHLPPGATELALELAPGTRALLIGGEPFDEDITIWWNFVGHGKPYITQAQRDWQAGSARFGEVQGFDGPRLDAPAVPWAS